MARNNEELAPKVTQLSAVRQKRLLEVVKDRSAISVRELCDYLQVSDATVRRDLTFLEKKKLLSRTHGGVVANSIVSFDLPHNARAQLNEDEKHRIGMKAIDMLEGNETVMIDAGTTALSVATHAHTKPNCTYVTTSLGVAQTLNENGINKHYLIGGSYLPLNGAYCGSIAIGAIRNLSFDVSFLCTSAIDIHRRAISMSSEMYSLVQREIISVSRQNIVIADHSKFKASAFSQTATFEDLDALITDSTIPDSTRQSLEDENLELYIV